MSNAAIKWAYDQPIMPAGAKFILVTLADVANGDGYCYPGQEKLSALTGQSERAVRKHLEDLEAAGLLRRGHRYDRRGKRTSDHFVLVGFVVETAEEADLLLADHAGSKRPTTGRNRTDYRKKSSSLPADSSATIRSEPLEEPSGEPSVSASAHIDELRDALSDAVFARSPERLPPSARSALNAAADELATQPDATPAEVRRRVWIAQTTWSDSVMVTPSAIAAQWPALGRTRSPNGHRHDREPTREENRDKHLKGKYAHLFNHDDEP